MNQRVAERLLETYTPEELNRALDKYKENLVGIVDDEGLTEEEYLEAFTDAVLEEFLADAYAGINAFGAHAERYQGDVESAMDELYMGKARNQDNGTRQTNGPNENTAGEGGVRYSAEDGTIKDATELSRSDLRYLLEGAQNGVLPDNSYIPLRRNTPEFFIGVVEEHSRGSVVVENHPMVSTVRHIRQNMDEEDGQTYGRERPHGFEPDDIITISEKMGDPAYIVLQNNGRYAEVISFYNKRNKQVLVAIDLADSSSAEPKNYKYAQYMNGYGGGFYNVVVTQHELDSLKNYLDKNEVVYSKKEMNGRYQVGSGRIVTVTHDTPFIEDIITEQQPGVKEISAQDRSKEAAGDSEEWVSWENFSPAEMVQAQVEGRYDNETRMVRVPKPAETTDAQKAKSQAVEKTKEGKSKFSADDLSAMEEELEMRQSQNFQDRLMEDGGSAAWVANQKRIEVLGRRTVQTPEDAPCAHLYAPGRTLENVENFMEILLTFPKKCV